MDFENQYNYQPESNHSERMVIPSTYDDSVRKKEIFNATRNTKADPIISNFFLNTHSPKKREKLEQILNHAGQTFESIILINGNNDIIQSLQEALVIPDEKDLAIYARTILRPLVSGVNATIEQSSNQLTTFTQEVPWSVSDVFRDELRLELSNTDNIKIRNYLQNLNTEKLAKLELVLNNINEPLRSLFMTNMDDSTIILLQEIDRISSTTDKQTNSIPMNNAFNYARKFLKPLL
jgi:hypothetical protein